MSYLPLGHSKRDHAITTAIETIQASGLNFDSIVACGLSGALVAPAVAAELGKNLVFVRKGESSHGHQVEVDWMVQINRYIIIDDCVESGKTIERIRRRVDGKRGYGGVCLGAYFYDQDGESGFVETFKARNESLWIKTSR